MFKSHSEQCKLYVEDSYSVLPSIQCSFRRTSAFYLREQRYFKAFLKLGLHLGKPEI